MTQRLRMALIGGVGALLSFFVFGGLHQNDAARDPLDAIPKDSFLVATLNAAEFRRSPLYDVLFGKETSPAAVNPRALGLGKLADACGFEPLGRVERLALGVPEEGDHGELGVAARVNVTSDELARCAEGMARARGGKTETRDVGSFVVLGDLGSKEPAQPRLAYGRPGLLVVGRGAWFDAMLAAADRKGPAVRDGAGHASVRASLTKADGWKSPTLIVTALLPKTLRDRLRGELEQEREGDVQGAGVMAGVLGVSSVGLALRAGPSGGTIDVAAELACDSTSACDTVEKLLLKKRLEWSKELKLRMVGLGPLLDSIEVQRDGEHLHVAAGAPAAALATTLERVLRLSR